MTDKPADLADELARARAEVRVLDARAWRAMVTSVDQAYLVQSQLAARAGHDVLGWKVTALSAEQQRDYPTDRPVAGALLSPFVHAAPAALSAAQFIVPLLECEVAFVLGVDLPPRLQPIPAAKSRPQSRPLSRRWKSPTAAGRRMLRAC